MSFTKSEPKECPEDKKQEFAYIDLNMENIDPEKLSVQMRVYWMLRKMGDERVMEFDNLRELQAKLIYTYFYKFMSVEVSVKNVIDTTLRLESSIGRAIRKLREWGVLKFNPKTYQQGSKKFEENRITEGDTAIEGVK